MRQNTGLQPTDNVANRYGAANLGALSGMNSGTYEGQVAAAQERNARSAARVQANRLAGASDGGDILRQINKLNNRAQSAYDTALGRGLNSRAAARAAEAVQAQANTLVGAQGNVIRSRGQDLAVQTADADRAAYRERSMADLTAAQSKAALELEQRASERGYEMLDDIATFNGPDGKPVKDYGGAAIAMDLLNVDPRNRAMITKNATAIRGLIQFRNELLPKLGHLPDAAEMERIYNQGAGASDLEWGDIWKEGDINVWDLIKSNIGFGLGPDAIRLGPNTALKYDGRNLTREQQADFWARDPDNPRNQ